MPDETRERRPLPSPDDGTLLPFLPMLYVAWADGDLEPEEIRAICGRLMASQGPDSLTTAADLRR